MNGAGQPFSKASSCSADSFACGGTCSFLSPADTAESAAEIDESTDDPAASSFDDPCVFVFDGKVGFDWYCWPRHQIGAVSSFLGKGSQKYLTNRLPYLESSSLFMSGLSTTGGRVLVDAQVIVVDMALSSAPDAERYTPDFRSVVADVGRDVLS